ncbi:carboxynorspermidine decarboxylase [Dysgonomonas sp. PFB1-18]|uniref:carboxynorspermidine decarboxylase n=1 Tax=unclassified Dysgonomonas TaxID=2630389 RepID=UPI002475A666|nr:MULTISPECIES: carboxynorspermidine decarboxylase [unclassified Dysgonomonas]MDH6309779.1 carboxynorspermidine decarboxylase [Dysgonomonas sp. PF1-14]MDH6339213.1 carboxynorspermidine decarboxylase [Dysgonomonas sp. PF1-16]MDH6380712.1 carboxynorspermidine decarboxylase [Dysgonomonas sp. PFB1-18]MDH6398208.1 carboxynorspermidine decarboxylase [Dysgonomonas sp. PF1-23]
MIEINKIPSPCFVMEEELLRKNLSLIKSVKERAGVNIILAFKAFAMWKSFPIIREYVPYSTASSVFEAQLAFEEMGSLAHTFSPAYTAENFPVFMRYSSHITFNSLSQFERFYPETLKYRKKVSCGLRINPEYSVVETDLYNPATPGSRLGVSVEQLGNELPEGIEGLHFHTLCESSSYDLEKTLEVIEQKFGHLLPKVKWFNMGGGHLMTRKDYDVEHLIRVLQSFKAKYPNLEIIMEPGSAFAWETGVLVSTVVDIVENRGIKTAILDVSFACHMPDCLEMPYKPRIRGAYHEPVEGRPTYRMGGSSCLSGDFIGEWSFDEPLLVGDKIIFEDMIHYTIVKTTMFNGISHPAIALWNKYNQLEIYREFDYEDYKNRMS